MNSSEAPTMEPKVGHERAAWAVALTIVAVLVALNALIHLGYATGRTEGAPVTKWVLLDWTLAALPVAAGLIAVATTTLIPTKTSTKWGVGVGCTAATAVAALVLAVFWI